MKKIRSYFNLFGSNTTFKVFALVKYSVICTGTNHVLVSSLILEFFTQLLVKILVLPNMLFCMVPETD